MTEYLKSIKLHSNGRYSLIQTVLDTDKEIPAPSYYVICKNDTCPSGFRVYESDSWYESWRWYRGICKEKNQAIIPLEQTQKKQRKQRSDKGKKRVKHNNQ